MPKPTIRINPDALVIIRQRSRLTQSELARKANVPQETMSRIESGTRRGTEAQIMALADALNVPVTAISHTEARS